MWAIRHRMATRAFPGHATAPESGRERAIKINGIPEGEADRVSRIERTAGNWRTSAGLAGM
jgi:hypothetical protein